MVSLPVMDGSLLVLSKFVELITISEMWLCVYSLK